MKTFFLFSLTILLLGAGCQKIIPPQDMIQEDNTKVYCSPIGELIRTHSNQSHRSYCLQTQKQEPVVAQPLDYSFSIIDDQGEITKKFEVVHEKIMHVIVIRRDLNNFQHIHPEFDESTGVFTLKGLAFPEDGPYRLYFDFTPSNSQIGSHGERLPVTLSTDIPVGDTNNNQNPNLTDESTVKTVDQFKVTLNPTTTLHEISEENNKKPPEKITSGAETTFRFQVEDKDGQPIEHVSKYLGELGHLVILQADTLRYIHTHPVHSLTNIYNQIPFTVTFPEPGKYKLFLEFKYGKKIYVVNYGVTVEKEEGEINQ